MQVCDAYYAHGGFGIYTDFSTQQEKVLDTSPIAIGTIGEPYCDWTNW
jgi:hypothetical protein